MSVSVQPDRILHELAELWVSLAKEPAGESSGGVLRACAMTLVTAAEESEDATNIGETLAALMREHPSRAVVIRFRAGAERAIEARVFAQCWMPFGQRRQICCEQIEILASDSALPDLPAVIVPLVAADLPVVLWVRGARLFRLPDFALLAGIAQKMILDSAEFSEPGQILSELSGRLNAEYALADLAWTRLTRWRELISQIFENRRHLPSLPAITELRIEMSEPRPPVSAFYLAAWLLDSLRLAGASAKLTWMPGQPDSQAVPRGHGQFRRIEFVANGDVKLVMQVESDGAAVNVTIEGLTARTVLAERNDYDLLREELSIPGHDAIFEKTLARAARLARGES